MTNKTFQMKKKTTARSHPLTIPTDSTFMPLFNNLMDGSMDKHVDPFRCIPFANVRAVTESGVQRLVALFDDNYIHEDGTPSTGLALGSNLPIVVQLTGSLLTYVRQYFKESGKTDEDINLILAKNVDWYGIVDGLHHNHAVRWHIRHNKRWESQKWYVKVLKGGYRMEDYSRLARFQNHLHSPKYSVELILFDQLYNLRKDYDRLCLKKKNVSQKEVAQSYFGLKTVNRTMTMMASLSIRLSWPVLTELGKIMNMELPQAVVKQKKAISIKTEDEALKSQDCRLFRSFLKLNSLYGSTAFMNHSPDNGFDPQKNTLHRLKDYSSLNNYCSVQHDKVTEQYKLSVDAMFEEKKFLTYLESDEWPTGMENIRHNLLRTTAMDEELVLNRGNDHCILDSLHSALCRIDPDRANHQDEAVKRKNELDKSKRDHHGDDSNNTTDDGTGICDKPTNKHNDQANATDTDTPELSEKELKKNTLEHDRERLQSKGIECFNMTYNEYISSEWSAREEKVDLVISEPPASPSRSPIHSVRSNSTDADELSLQEVKELPNNLRRVLKTGGYVILVMNFHSYMEWYNAFYDSGYDVMPAPYILAYKSDTVQIRNNRYFPQVGYKVAMIARLPSVRDEGFKPDFASMFNLVQCSNDRHCSIMFNIIKSKSVLCKPGSRMPFSNDELSPCMLSELIDLFTPQGGRVMDIMAGTFTTGIAALQTGRDCICVERNTQCFDEAFNRIKSYLPSTTNIVDHVQNLRNTTKMSKTPSSDDLSESTDFNSHMHNENVPQVEEQKELKENEEQTYPSSALGLTERQAKPNTKRTASPDLAAHSNSGCTSSQDDANLLLSMKGVADTSSSSIDDWEEDEHSDYSFPSRKPKRRRPPSFNGHDLRPLKRNTQSHCRTEPLSIGLKRVTAPTKGCAVTDSDSVVLFIGSKAVGTAALRRENTNPLQKEGNSDNFVTRLHGHDLSKWQRDDQLLVVIYKVKINNMHTNLVNPYDFQVGVENSPKALGELLSSGFYPWDLKMTDYFN